MTDSHTSRGPTIVRLGRSTSGEETNLVIRLRRNDTSHPWGFRMLGGRDQGSCLYVHKVTTRSIAERNGLRPGDGLLAIAGVSSDGMTHDQAKMEILRAGNELDLYILRNAMPVTSEIVKRQRSMEETRAEIIEEPSNFDTGYQNPNIQSRSFKILQEALNYTEAPDNVTIYRFRLPSGQGVDASFTESSRAAVASATQVIKQMDDAVFDVKSPVSRSENKDTITKNGVTDM